MRHFIITEDDGQSRQVFSPFHPCDDPPPVTIALGYEMPDGTKIPPVVNDPEPLYDGPRENVTEIEDNAEGAAAMDIFTGRKALREQKPELFEAPGKNNVKVIVSKKDRA